jgi:two-component system LytT family response regulator
MLRVMLVDDEPPARRGLRRLLQDYPDVEVVAEAGSLSEARALASAGPIDAIFLDVELSDGRGFDLVAELRQKPAIVFVTAHDFYAVNAFDVAALDFLLKPIVPERLGLSIERLRAHRKQALRLAPALETGQDEVEFDSTPRPGGERPRIHLRIDGRSVIAPLDSIAMLTAEADFTRLFLDDARNYLICRLLHQFEAQLPTPPFVRVSRSLIVNLGQVERVEWQEGGRCSVSLGKDLEPVMLGRIAARRLRQSIAQHSIISA